MRASQKSKWERTRSKGKKHFLIYNGVIGWGIPTAIIFTFLTEFLENNYSSTFDTSFIMTLLKTLIIFPVCGYFWGLWVWKWTEKIYKKSL
ncbi:hypothetical protein [Paenibacillus rhizophilus]|uniref:Uncharacterized protein n=1 Tax=Paenibacillus rhizophilus TaxID=1850366 RepID=A0A3N9P7P0_9BACL|nr:hypothetical protein [Paenibacillus rhizophilus]RQW12263.1 hypothetical protein EH198_07870 [Paenibacillus rhizophilus]